jgi:hypothetical protein
MIDYSVGYNMGDSNTPYSQGRSSGGGSGGGGGTAPVNTPTDREIAFNVSSNPSNCSIFINGTDSGYKTPYTLVFREKEILTNSKVIDVYNSSSKLKEQYIITAKEIVTSTQVTPPAVTLPFDGAGPTGGGVSNPYDGGNNANINNNVNYLN